MINSRVRAYSSQGEKLAWTGTGWCRWDYDTGKAFATHEEAEAEASRLREAGAKSAYAWTVLVPGIDNRATDGAGDDDDQKMRILRYKRT